jgi:hypothetical protein
MTITYQPTYNNLTINTNKERRHGCDTVILDRLDDQFNHMIERHSKVLQVRLDLRYPQDHSVEPQQGDFHRFCKNFKRNLERNYPLVEEGKVRSKKIHFKNEDIPSIKHQVDPHITLVLEKHTTENHPHAHVVVHVNGNAKKSPYGIQQRAVREWNTVLGTTGNTGLVDFCDRENTCSYIIDRNSPDFETIRNQAFHQASYLAKMRGKEDRNKGSWRVIGSRIE